MSILLSSAMLLLLAAAVVPLLFVGLFALASYFELAIADRLLDVVARLLQGQFLVGGVVNVAGGLCIAALGIWLVAQAPTAAHWLLAGTLIPLGLWRLGRGVAVLRGFSGSE